MAMRLQMFWFSLLVTSGMVANTCAAEGRGAQCSVDMVPIQITDEVSGPGIGPVTTLSAVKISDSNPYLRNFVTAITGHVAARLVKDKLCFESADRKQRSLLQFVNLPLRTSANRPLTSVPSLDARLFNGCRIYSPWIDIAFERKPVPSIRAVVRWNQRQMIVDQAVLAGARSLPKDVALPFDGAEYGGFADEYANSEILHKPAAKPIEERIPPDVLWLFRRSWQSTRGPFTSAINMAVEQSAERYTTLVIALIDRCFASERTEIHYGSILDTADLISLKRYKIDTLIR